MASRDILDYQSNVIGQLSEPEGIEWTEEQWAEMLAPYAVSPPSPEEMVTVEINKTIEDNQQYAQGLMKRMKALNLSSNMNIGQAMWIHHRLRALDVNLTPIGIPITVTLDLLNLVVSGDVETGCVALQLCVPDDMSQPYHCLSAEFLAWTVADMKAYLGWA
jgi:hypothetical protein